MGLLRQISINFWLQFSELGIGPHLCSKMSIVRRCGSLVILYFLGVFLCKRETILRRLDLFLFKIFYCPDATCLLELFSEELLTKLLIAEGMSSGIVLRDVEIT